MRNFLFIAFLSHFLLGIDSEADEFHEFTSADGARKISAKVDSQTGDSYRITLADGRSLSVKPSAFSETDQAFLKEWSENNISYNFTVEEDRTKVDSREKNMSPWTYVIDTVGYKVTLENRASTSIENLKVHYMAFKDEHDFNNTSRSSAQTTSISGTYELESIEAKSEHLFETDTLEITEGELGAGWRVPGGKNKYKDRLSGLWIKIFHKDKEIFEFKTNDSSIKDARWKHDATPTNKEKTSE